MTRRTLPRAAYWIVRRVIPQRRVTQILDDLEDDYARANGTMGQWAARGWLARETLSLVVSYAVEPLRRATHYGPILVRDMHIVARGLRRGPIAALGAAAMLSTGLVAVLLTAGLTDALLFRQVSAVHGERLRRIGAVDRQGRSALRLSYVEVDAVRTHLAAAGTLSLVNMQPVVIRAGSIGVQTMAEAVDGRYFELTGTKTIVGRGLLTTDDRPDSPPATVIAAPFWQRQFGGSPDALGQTMLVNGQAFTVVGVADSLGSSSFLGASVDAWVPIAHADSLLNRGWRTNVNDRWFSALVLPHGSTPELEARLAAAAAELARLHPDLWRERRLQTSPATVVTGSQRATVLTLASILAALAALILATAASNVGGVLLSRAAAARRLAAIHLSMGAGRAAIVRRQLIEGALLGAGGAVIALALYAWARHELTSVALLPTLALRLDLPLNASVFTVVAVAGLLAGLGLALGPAVSGSRIDLADALRDGGHRAGAGRGFARARRALVSAQVAMSLALVVGAALFVQSLDALSQTDIGFARENLVAMDFDLEPSGPPASELPALARDALERTRQVPGVLAAAMSNRAPIDQSTPSQEVRLDGSDASGATDATFYLATHGYFETVGVPILSGRSFTPDEAMTGAEVVVVNEALAARLFPGGDALGRSIFFPSDQTRARVVGIARNSKYRSLAEGVRPHFYRPTAPSLGRTLLVRARSAPRVVLRSVQSTLDSVGPGVVGFFPRTLDDHLAIDLLPTRAAATAATVLGTIALVLSSVGLFGLVSWFVELRRGEIGVRMALGASAADVRTLVVRQTVATALPGVVIGIVVAGVLGFAARAALFGVAAIDLTALAIGVAAIAAIVAAAAYLPSRRATRVDPVEVLRFG